MFRDDDVRLKDIFKSDEQLKKIITGEFQKEKKQNLERRNVVFGSNVLQILERRTNPI